MSQRKLLPDLLNRMTHHPQPNDDKLIVGTIERVASFVGWVLQSKNTWLLPLKLTVPTLHIAVDRSPFFPYPYSSSSQRLPLEFLVELL